MEQNRQVTDSAGKMHAGAAVEVPRVTAGVDQSGQGREWENGGGQHQLAGATSLIVG